MPSITQKDATDISTTVATAPSHHDLLNLVTQRRSNYTLSPSSTVSDAELKRILEVTLAQAPSTMGSYTTRMVLVVKDQHYALWDTITDIVKGVTPAEKWATHTAPRLAGFRNAYGTVLFFEDPTNTRELQSKFPFIADAFPTFSQHTAAIHQYIVWTALTAAGLGANLQHYHPLIDDRVKAQYDIPSHWELTAQLVFGTPTAPSGPKPTAMAAPMDERLRIYGADLQEEFVNVRTSIRAQVAEAQTKVLKQ